MNPIQLLLLCFIALSFMLCLYVLRRQLLGRLFFAGQFILGALFVVFPDLSSRIARLLGVGRGTDLVLYVTILLFYAATLLFIAKFRRLERNQTAIIRSAAITNALKPADMTNTAAQNK